MVRRLQRIGFLGIPQHIIQRGNNRQWSPPVSFGEPIKNTASIGTETAVEMNYSRDALGRITQKTEVIKGETLTDSYQYDLTGRLISATRSGITTTWSYDENGNRTHINGQSVAGYDEQDRLVSYQGASYEYTENGELKSKI